MVPFKIALAQINPTLGAFLENSRLILRGVKRAHSEGCDLVVFPEASLFGYHPMDLLERQSIVEAQMKVLDSLQKQLPKGIGVFIGAIVPSGKKRGKAYYNAALFLQQGKKPRVFPKQLLPTYDVFDESRHIEPGETAKNIFSFKGKKLIVTICEDIWAWNSPYSPAYARYGQNPLAEIQSTDIDLVVNLSASPFTDEKLKARQFVVAQTARHFGAPMLYVNMVGGQDEMVFDGGSYAVDDKGRTLIQCRRFEEDFKVIDFSHLPKRSGKTGLDQLTEDLTEQRRQAIVLGLRDFVRKTGFQRVHLGLSGGVDSAVVACLAAEALGPESVAALTLPGPYTSEEGLAATHELAKRLGIGCYQLPIGDLFERQVEALDKLFGMGNFGLTHENLQARQRALFLMAYANKYHSLLLNTSNKSELAMGYSTLYGDLSGGICVIGDLLKREVYDLARLFQREGDLIPEFIIDRPPSAELAANQKDEDHLPPYSQLDGVVEKLVEGHSKARGTLDQQVLKAMMGSEFKRWQAPPILKLSSHSFGRGRRFPIAHRAYY